tara:strand:+ start:874 stop:1287 length:414 start_codon:yes stop_codon:yes gene_type:complete
MRFENNKDLVREKKAIEYFVKRFEGSYKKLGPNDVDYKVFDKDSNLIAYAEVKGRYRSLANCYPLPIACRKVVKLCDKRLNPVMIWACDDGIIYGQPSELDGYVKWGGRKPRDGAVNDQELMIYYDKQKTLRYFRYY